MFDSDTCYLTCVIDSEGVLYGSPLNRLSYLNNVGIPL